MTLEEFFKVMDWLSSKDTEISGDYVRVENRIYWLDSQFDRNALHELYLRTKP